MWVHEGTSLLHRRISFISFHAMLNYHCGYFSFQPISYFKDYWGAKTLVDLQQLMGLELMTSLHLLLLSPDA
jgi:hypothetical protein